MNQDKNIKFNAQQRDKWHGNLLQLANYLSEKVCSADFDLDVWVDNGVMKESYAKKNVPGRAYGTLMSDIFEGKPQPDEACELSKDDNGNTVWLKTCPTTACACGWAPMAMKNSPWHWRSACKKDKSAIDELSLYYDDINISDTYAHDIINSYYKELDDEYEPADIRLVEYALEKKFVRQKDLDKILKTTNKDYEDTIDIDLTIDIELIVMARALYKYPSTRITKNTNVSDVLLNAALGSSFGLKFKGSPFNSSSYESPVYHVHGADVNSERVNKLFKKFNLSVPKKYGYKDKELMQLEKLNSPEFSAEYYAITGKFPAFKSPEVTIDAVVCAIKAIAVVGINKFKCKCSAKKWNRHIKPLWQAYDDFITMLKQRADQNFSVSR